MKAIPVIFALLIAGCGYQQSGSIDTSGKGEYRWASLYRQDVQTVAVPIFTNKDFRRGIEFSLTKAVVSNLEMHSPYKVVPRERADTILEGEITAVSVGPLSRDRRANIPQEQMLTMTVNFTWKDLRTGQILQVRRGFQQTATHYPMMGEGEFVSSQQAVERLAMAIVQELQADW